MALTREQRRLARLIDTYVQDVTSSGGTDADLLQGMYDYMAPFKQLLDTCTSEEIDRLCQEYDGFYRFAKLLENLARGLADGTIQVPEEG